jgi:hypothetical protein
MVLNVVAKYGNKRLLIVNISKNNYDISLFKRKTVSKYKWKFFSFQLPGI